MEEAGEVNGPDVWPLEDESSHNTHNTHNSANDRLPYLPPHLVTKATSSVSMVTSYTNGHSFIIVHSSLRSFQRIYQSFQKWVSDLF